MVFMFELLGKRPKEVFFASQHLISKMLRNVSHLSFSGQKRAGKQFEII